MSAAAGRVTHRLLTIDTESMTGTCLSCGPVSLLRKRAGLRCAVAVRSQRRMRTQEAIRRQRKKQKQKRRGYRAFLGPCCVRCGFVAEHPCQLDVDHIDANHANDDPKNLQTLCANCHRLKSHKEREPPKP